MKFMQARGIVNAMCPARQLARVLAIGIGICGLFLTGLIVGISGCAMRTALGDRQLNRSHPLGLPIIRVG